MSRGRAGASGAGESVEPEDFELSPSENAAHDTALRISGTKDLTMRTQKALASIVLGFELIIVVLIGLTLFGLGTLEPRYLGLIIGGALALVTIAGLGFMRVGRVGINIGWVLHVLMIATGFLVPAAFFVGAIFTALWIYCMIKGSRMDRDRAAWLATQ
ncbi:membrane-bound ClpP family serine protease [Leucobacter exalbidus]|uniref:Membrane-bound ClpP family serine protease n=1 Tax=Leucobacter exalbidus TaxID=662960 RepID=A0A940PU13_9MICO|nr:DUF4233 domain-containing protein [Leucobacter exalbidus]MBP1325269.1 membrane-bound ClpP family serine protease [Leucobacter exalbidus]